MPTQGVARTFEIPCCSFCRGAVKSNVVPETMPTNPTQNAAVETRSRALCVSTLFLTLESQTPALQWLTMEPSSPYAQIALTLHTVTPAIPTPVSTQPVVRWAEPVWLFPSGGAGAAVAAVGGVGGGGAMGGGGWLGDGAVAAGAIAISAGGGESNSSISTPVCPSARVISRVRT